MKRILTLVLALTMVLSLGVAAFADESFTSEGTNMKSAVGSPDTNFLANSEKTSATQKTDVWLQVEAKGQIEVTVPLVVVFSTNINGGTAVTPNGYALKNHSSADLAVTTVVFADDKTLDAAAKGSMKLVAETDNPAEDNYYATLIIDGKVDSAKLDASTGTYSGGVGNTAADADKPIAVLEKAKADGTAVSAPMSLTVKTGKLSFVTKKDSSDEYGARLMNITYTVAIDQSNAVSTAIAGKDIPYTASWANDGTPNTPAVNASYDYTSVNNNVTP